jgi:hypothetical protein
MKYAIIDNEGKASAFYDSDIHPVIPQGAIEVTKEQWQEYLQNQGRRKFVNGQLVEIQKTLEEHRAEKIAALQSKRLAVAESGIDFSGKNVPIDKEAIVLLMASQIYMKDKPNKKIKRAGLGELTGAQVDAMIEAIGQKYDAAFANEADLFDSIMAASTVEELEAIDIESGW